MNSPSTLLRQRVNAPWAAVCRALLDPHAIAIWDERVVEALV